MKLEDMRNDKYYYLVDCGKIFQITTQDIRSDNVVMIQGNLFETQEEAIERLLEVLDFKLYQLEDDKDSVLYNIKELKKKLKIQKNILFLRKINEF